MVGIPLPLAQVLPLLPPDSRGHLELLHDLCPGILCVVTGEGGEPRFILEVQAGGRTLRTGAHRHISPGLVAELSALLSGHLGRVI